ncbi:hypothetical protein CFOL_v3_04316, partial [Cephalotus follicularis]
HDDVVVVTLAVENFEVNRVLIDNGTSTDILYYEVFEKMKISKDKLKPIDSPLSGFSGEPIQVKGIIKPLITVGVAPCQSTVSLNALGAIVSKPLLKMKFPTISGVGEVKGDQKMAV